MRMRLGMAVGAAVGYVLGSKAGRGRYEELKQVARRVGENPVAQSAVSTVQAQASKVEHMVSEKLGRAQDSGSSTSGDALQQGSPEELDLSDLAAQPDLPDMTGSPVPTDAPLRTDGS